ncbi:MAG: OmpA family protein [Bacteroidota bacterium]
MSRPVKWLLSLLGLLVLCVACVAALAPSIEASLARQAQEALTNAGLADAATLTVDGRDVLISADDPEIAEQARALLAGLDGLRVVDIAAPEAPLPEVALEGPFALMPLADGGLALRGQVPDEATRDALLAAARDAFGDEVRDGLEIDSTASGDWAEAAAAALPRLQGVTAPGLAIDADGDFVISGTVDDEGRRRNVETRMAEVIAPRTVRNDLALVGSADDTSGTVAAADSAATPEASGDTDEADAPADADSTATPAPAASGSTAGRVAVENALSGNADAAALERALRQRLGSSIVTFEPGTDRLSPGSREVLARAAAAFKQYPDVAVELQAHTDSQGSASSNFQLSAARARAAKRALVDAGVSGSQLFAAAYGQSTPIASNDTEAGRAQNRRIAFKLIPRPQ